jgi:putative spermidine/putrescine transport system substrate-binding protein
MSKRRSIGNGVSDNNVAAISASSDAAGGGVSRRDFVKGAGSVAIALSAPFVVTRAKAATQVVCRNPGGAYGDALQAAYYAPFTKATGIEVVGVPASAGKLLAMVQSGNTEIDVADVTELTALVLERQGALVPVTYDDWKFGKTAEVAKVRRPNMVGSCWTANVICYNTDVFKGDNHPASCADLWNIAKFPGPRMLQSMQAGFPELEFALLADGVAMNKLYPIDISRAFKSMSRIKKNVAKFYDTGGVQVDLLTTKEVVCGSAYNGRIAVGQQKGAPLGIEWNQANNQLQVQCILKGSKNQASAQRFIDFIMQPQVQADFAKYIPYGPTNREAFKLMTPELSRNVPNFFEDKVFYQDAVWWADHRDEVEKIWNEWSLT